MDCACEDQLAVTVRDAHFRFYVHYVVDPSGIATRNSRSQNALPLHCGLRGDVFDLLSQLVVSNPLNC